MMNSLKEVPEAFRQVCSEIVALTDAFCEEHLGDEYQELCREMAASLCQPGSPAAWGKTAGWACGIVYSVGWVNFLTDPQQEPHMRAEAIAEGFGVSSATMYARSKTIRRELGLTRFDPDFWLPSRLEDNPLAWLVDIHGLLLDARSLPRDVQEAAFEDGLIPYVPAGGPARKRHSDAA